MAKQKAADKQPAKKKDVAGIAQLLSEGTEVSGFTLVPVKKAKANHKVKNTGERIERDGVEFAVVELK